MRSVTIPTVNETYVGECVENAIVPTLNHECAEIVECASLIAVALEVEDVESERTPIGGRRAEPVRRRREIINA